MLFRSNQRGIVRDMITLALDHGEPEGDKTVLTAKTCRQLIEDLKRTQKKLEHVAKKGGITVVSEGDKVITAYRANSFRVTRAKKIKG